MIKNGTVVWITGLSGAGKSTFMNFLHDELLVLGHKSIILDGDSLRSILGYSTSKYSKDERLQLAFVYSRLCKYLSEQGYTVLIATIALFHKIHQWNRDNLSSYFEVFIDIPIHEIRARNNITVYDDQSPTKEVMGVDFEAEFPQAPNLIVTGNLKNFIDKSRELAALITQGSLE